jgi:hypothetical protein
MSTNTCVVPADAGLHLSISSGEGPASRPFPDAGLPTAERIQREISPVLNMRLSPALQSWVARYAEVGKRNPYLWNWCKQGVEITMLPCVAPELRDYVGDTRVLGVMLDVLLDDVADRRGDEDLLEKLLSISFDGPAPDVTSVPADQRGYAKLTFDVWDEIKARAARFPCFDKYARVLRYDYLQLFNVMRYSHLINGNLALLNMAEHNLYTPHNMHMMVSSTLDLMCSPDFDGDELGALRDLIWNAQCMGRVGNLVTTWERELADGDYTSGVYAHAMAGGDVTLAMLRNDDRDRIRKGIVDGGHEAYFLERWHEHRRYLLSKASQIRSFDFGQFINGLERLICIHLGSRGYK